MKSAPADPSLTALLTPDQRLALAYAGRRASRPLATLFALDRTLANAVARASQPISGQIRLAWWRDLLERRAHLAAADPVAAGVLELARDATVQGSMTAMVNGWETLFAVSLDDDALRAYAVGRGGGLYCAGAQLTGQTLAGGAGQAWALTDFAFHSSDRATAERALQIARAIEPVRGLPRPLAILDRFARRDASRGLARGDAAGTPWRIWDAVAGAITGN